MNNILNLATHVVDLIKRCGHDADVVVSESCELSVSQRLKKLEEVTQAKDCRIGIRAIVNKNKLASVSTNDFTEIEKLVERVVGMAKHAPEDSYIALALPDQFKKGEVDSHDLKILDRQIITKEDLENFVTSAEDSAMSFEKITNSEGATASYSTYNTILATSNGFIGSYSKTSFCGYISVIAGENGEMELGDDYSIACNFCDLKNPRLLGEEAAEKARRKLKSRMVRTCKVPVVLENRVASALLKNFASAINGGNIANKSSFLVSDMNKKIFSDGIDIIDDPHMIKGVASRPFDGEGMPGGINYVVKDGIINSWILDIRAGNKLKLASTGNAIRSDNGSVNAAVSNFYIKKSKTSVPELIADIKNGLYVTDLFGSGTNLTTGDYSQGASGFWIENGRISYPVSGITIAGNLRDMFAGLCVADDLIFRSSINSPTVRINEMTVAGS